MLTHLRITDFALLDDVSLDLLPGFNVLTGETGAGKSLLVDAVALLRGGRASAEVVRAGAEEARIEAAFEPSGSAAEGLAGRLDKAGLDASASDGNEAPELIVRRVIGRSRGRVYVNGSLATAGVLAELTGDLIDLAGQHEHQKLMDASQHLGMLDSFGLLPQGTERTAEPPQASISKSVLDEAQAAYTSLAAASEALKALSLDERARAEREDFLRFQVREIDEAELQDGEDAKLKVERERLRGAEKLLGSARRAEQALYSREGSIVDELATLVRDLEETGRADAALAKLGQQVGEARVQLEDAADSLRRYADSMHADPERLQEVEERQHLVGKLVRKHGADIAEVLRKRDAMAKELAALGSHEERRAEAEKALSSSRTRAEKAAAALHRAREKAAKQLGDRVSKELQALGMAGARLHVELTDRATREGDDPALVFDGKKLGPAGWDRAEFLLGANVGEEPRPLHRVASGGELSRIMLALKRVLARADVVGTYVFDEVDSGIGGSVADVVGRQIKLVAADKQVLCVTHLPQIAAYGDAHFHVEKRTIDGRTRTIVRKLTDEERVEELARMVGGAQVTSKARAHAEELMRHARGTRDEASEGAPAPAPTSKPASKRSRASSA